MDLPPTAATDPNQIVLITGPSGSGKSQTMQLIASDWRRSTATVTDVHVPNEPLIEGFGDDPRDAIRRLIDVGLSDPYTWCRTPDELSVGQRARLRLAHTVRTDDGPIVVDEWLNTIDDATAKAVAYRTGRVLRRAGRGALLATTRAGLHVDLCPDVHIDCTWAPTPKITERVGDHGSCTLLDAMTYRQGSAADWRPLRHLHYAAGDPSTVHTYHVAEHPDVDGPAAVALLSYPDLHSGARNLATDDRYKIGGSRKIAQRLNREVLRLSRIVVTPELRSIGLARWLITRMVESINARYVECVTAMGPYTSFLDACGFREIPQAASTFESKLLDLVAQDRPPTHTMIQPAALQAWVDSLSVRRRRLWRRTVWNYYHHYVLHRRTGRAAPRRIAHDTDARWPDAWAMVSTRLDGRPNYYILGPIDPLTGLNEQ